MAKLEELEQRVRSLETTRTVIVAICVIFGVSGAWGYNVLQTSKTQLKGLADPTGQFNYAKEKALRDFSDKASQEKDAQVTAFKKESHAFTIDWEAPKEEPMLVNGQPNIDKKSLGKHDICMIVKTDFHIVANAESSCSLSLENNDWKLSVRHDALVNNAGSATGCAVVCGNIK